MEVAELVEKHPRVFHVAAAESWPSIQRHGLLSAEALLDRYGVTGEERDSLLRRPRPRSVTLQDPELGVAVVRDQLPLKFIERLVEPGTTVEDFCLALNARTYLAATRARLDRLLGARAYRGRPQVVLTVDTVALVARHADAVRLCRFNSGACTHLSHPVRGPGSWSTIADYPYDAHRRRYGDPLAEVTVLGGVPDVTDLVTDLEWVTP
ncbi:hypothetical protein [Nocardioides sp. CFH 31398]|uniref:DUF7002 family protein n=1 Tax=Nocardioides sp. CFH 31398 TaxID=2919579 RepID=UPI001F05E14F|nr:hypothetical protein [Nocardioides sp. CFH 31398]MCH1867331.1 hypothetical protein [Nocardioides sp. CFH 31398]